MAIPIGSTIFLFAVKVHRNPILSDLGHSEREISLKARKISC